MGVIGIKLIVSDHAAYVIEGHLGIFCTGRSTSSVCFVYVTNIGIQDHYIIKRVGSAFFSIESIATLKNGNIVVIRCKNGRNHALEKPLSAPHHTV